MGESTGGARAASLPTHYPERLMSGPEQADKKSGSRERRRGDGLVAAAGTAGDRDIIITMDADDTHAPGLILHMVRMISEGHDVVIASRYRSGSRTIGA